LRFPLLTAGIILEYRPAFATCLPPCHGEPLRDHIAQRLVSQKVWFSPAKDGCRYPVECFYDVGQPLVVTPHRSGVHRPARHCVSTASTLASRQDQPSSAPRAKVRHRPCPLSGFALQSLGQCNYAPGSPGVPRYRHSKPIEAPWRSRQRLPSNALIETAPRRICALPSGLHAGALPIRT
jgi:hypothetical protein